MGILSGKQKEEPMHYGEIFNSWNYLSGVKTMIATYQTFENHCGDSDLRKLITDLISQAKQEEKQVTNLLKVNGIGLPPSPPERARASINDIPVGARFNDPEISMSIQKDIATGIALCSTIIGQCTREDIAMMFGQFHVVKMQNGLQLLRMTKQKGWLVPPPLHVKKREKVET